jgi:hypothetical protein
MKVKNLFGGLDHQQIFSLRRRYRLHRLQFANADIIKHVDYAELLAAKATTFYEEIGSVGYHPQTERLEAVIYVNQPSGYGGNLCTDGSREYVRFFASHDQGASWEDLGLTSLSVWDVPKGTEGSKRLEYAVSLAHRFERTPCTTPQIVWIRAILSWNDIPDAGDPNFPIVWGEVHNTKILIEPSRRFHFADLNLKFKNNISNELIELIDPDTQILASPKQVDLRQLAKSYKELGVSQARLLYPALKTIYQNTAIQSSKASALQSLAKQIDIDLSTLDLPAVVDPGLFVDASKVDGNTSYEQLEAIGYDPERDEIVGILRIKKPGGYLGGPCTKGSQEYVTFWADLNANGYYETCIGTASVKVYDIATVPQDGLEIAVHLPADLLRWRLPCADGPVVVPVRAILSWAHPIPCTEPSAVPTWGNRLQTLVHIPPGSPFSGGPDPWLSRVGEIPTSFIDAAGYIQNAVAVASGAYFNNAPFGGRITLAGKIVNGTAGTRYRVMIRKSGVGGFVPLSLEPSGISLAITTPGPLTTVSTFHADAEGYYLYQDFDSSHYVEGNILAAWYTGAAEHGSSFDLRIDVKDPADPLNDIESDVVTVHIDNMAPEITLSFSTLSGDCAHFQENAVFEGDFTIADPHFGSFWFEILPSGPAHGVLPAPATGKSVFLGGTHADPGVSGTAGHFTLDTHGMAPCGYALVLHAYDRTNVNSGYASNYNKDSVGFCLGSPPAG